MLLSLYTYTLDEIIIKSYTANFARTFTWKNVVYSLTENVAGKEKQKHFEYVLVVTIVVIIVRQTPVFFVSECLCECSDSRYISNKEQCVLRESNVKTSSISYTESYRTVARIQQSNMSQAAGAVSHVRQLWSVSGSFRPEARGQDGWLHLPPLASNHSNINQYC